jgi:hypothetical protein
MNFELLKKKIAEKSGCDLKNKNFSADAFENVCSILQELHQEKQKYYGDYFERIKKFPNDLNIIRNFLEVEKKYFRCENIMKDIMVKNSKEIAERILDSYVDLAVYSIMGLAMLSSCFDQQSVPKRD